MWSIKRARLKAYLHCLAQKKKACSNMFSDCLLGASKKFYQEALCHLISGKLCFLQFLSLTASAHSQHEKCTSSWAQTFGQHISSLAESVAQIIKVNWHLVWKWSFCPICLTLARSTVVLHSWSYLSKLTSVFLLLLPWECLAFRSASFYKFVVFLFLYFSRGLLW